MFKTTNQTISRLISRGCVNLLDIGYLDFSCTFQNVTVGLNVGTLHRVNIQARTHIHYIFTYLHCLDICEYIYISSRCSYDSEVKFSNCLPPLKTRIINRTHQFP